MVLTSGMVATVQQEKAWWVFGLSCESSRGAEVFLAVVSAAQLGLAVVSARGKMCGWRKVGEKVSEARAGGEARRV